MKLDKKAGTGELSCKICGQQFQTGINCQSGPRPTARDLGSLHLLQANNNYLYGQISLQAWTFTPNGLMLVNSSKIQQIPMQTMMGSIPLMIRSETKITALERNRTVTWIQLRMEMKTLKGTTTDGGPRKVTQLQDRLLPPWSWTTLNHGSTITSRYSSYHLLDYKLWRSIFQTAAPFSAYVLHWSRWWRRRRHLGISNSTHVATSGRMNGLGTRSIFITNPHDLIDVVWTL